MEGLCSKHFLTALVILLTITSYLKSCSAAGRRQTAGTTNTEYIRSSCRSTTYPQLCYSTLASHANVIQTNPKLLATTALSMTLSTARTTSSMMLKLSQTHGLKPRVVAAMRDCVEEITDSVDELQKSIGEMNQMKGSNFQLIMSDVQTWVSAALTDMDTCTDGFASNAMNGNVKTMVRGKIVNIAHLTSNALALINKYASLNG